MDERLSDDTKAFFVGLSGWHISININQLKYLRESNFDKFRKPISQYVQKQGFGTVAV